MYEQRLRKIIFTPDEKGNCLVEEFGWVNNSQCCAWIRYSDLEEFIQEVTDIFGYGLFDDGSFNANIQADGVCIDICEAFGCCVDIETVFPKEKYPH